MNATAGKLAGMAVLIVLIASGVIYSRYGYSMLLAADGGFTNRLGDIAGGDFLVFYTAAAMTLKGAALDVWNHAAYEAEMLAIYGSNDLPLYFFNQPVALLLWAPFGLLDHLHALWVWTALPLLALAVVIQRLTGSLLAAGLAVISPLAAFTAGTGQTGILFAALLGLFMLHHQQRPASAGIAAALWTIKPHLALAMPFAMLLDRNWRGLAAMTAAVLAMALVTTAIFGFGIWQSFIDGIRFHAGEFFHAGNPNFDRNPSIMFLMLRLGASPEFAWAAQVSAAGVALVLFSVAWRQDLDPAERVLTLSLLVFLLTPKVMHYDAVIMVIPMAMMVPRLVAGTADWMLVGLLLPVWCLPYLEPVFRSIGFHPGGLWFLLGLALIAWRSVPALRGRSKPA
jgi:hypothetical protein